MHMHIHKPGDYGETVSVNHAAIMRRIDLRRYFRNFPLVYENICRSLLAGRGQQSIFYQYLFHEISEFVEFNANLTHISRQAKFIFTILLQKPLWKVTFAIIAYPSISKCIMCI